MLDEIEKALLDSLIFEESLSSLLDEVPFPKAVVTDTLKGLIIKEMVITVQVDEASGKVENTFIYDGDNLHRHHFRATKKGLETRYEH